MRSARIRRRQSMSLLVGLKAVPLQRNTFTTQIKRGLSHGEIAKLPERVLDPIQDPVTGEFAFMAGYDGFGEAPWGG